MIDIKEIEEEIKRLEQDGNTDYRTCEKLAILYAVREHLPRKAAPAMASTNKLTAGIEMPTI